MIEGKSIRSILVATNFGEGSTDVLRAAGEIALATNARLHVVHAHEDTLQGGDDDRIRRRVRSKRLNLLGTVIGVTRKAVDIASVRVHVGSAAEVILREAEAVGPDLIVFGAHREREAIDAFRATTVERVLSGVSVPCLVLNGELPLPLPEMLVAVSSSDDSRHLAGAAWHWADWLSQADRMRSTFTSILEDVAAEVETSLDRTIGIGTEDEARRWGGASGAMSTVVLAGNDPVREILHGTGERPGLIVAGTGGSAGQSAATTGRLPGLAHPSCERPVAPGAIAPLERGGEFSRSPST